VPSSSDLVRSRGTLHLPAHQYVAGSGNQTDRAQRAAERRGSRERISAARNVSIIPAGGGACVSAMSRRIIHVIEHLTRYVHAAVSRITASSTLVDGRARCWRRGIVEIAGDVRPLLKQIPKI
jgi:hypothetical protein